VNAILQRSPLTRPVGPDKTNRSVTVTLACSLLFDKAARVWRMAVNPMLRRFIAKGAEVEGHPQARELRQALCVPSIYDVATPETKAEIFADEMAHESASADALNFEPYLKEFAR
jgi:hypothetical protein